MTIAKMGIMPGGLTDYVLEDNTTVQGLFDVADADAIANETARKYGADTVAKYDIQLNGEKVEADAVVTDGATILLTKKIKGNEVVA